MQGALRGGRTASSGVGEAGAATAARRGARMMLLLRPLIFALTELDRLDEAREVVVEAMPLLRWFGWRDFFAPSWPSSRHGAGVPTLRRACWLRVRHAGHALADASSSSERHAEQKVRRLLVAAQADEQLSAWFREGAALSDGEFDRLVMHEATAQVTGRRLRWTHQHLPPATTALLAAFV